MKFGKSIPVIHCGILLTFGATLQCHATEAQLKEIEELKSEISTLEEKVAEIEGGADAGSDIEANITAAKNEISETKAGLIDRESEMAEKEFLLSVYRSSFRVVANIDRGAALGNVAMQDGSTLQNVVFVGISGGAVQLQTSTGLKTIPAGSLPASLAGSFQLPPGIPALPSSLDTIYSQKPDVAMTDADKEISSPMARFASNAGGEATTAPTGQAQPAPNMAANSATPAVKAEAETEEKPAYVLIKERNDARLKRIQQLRIEYSNLYAEVKKLKEEKYRQQAAFNSSKIKKAKAIQDKAFGVIDKKIDIVDTKIRNLKNEMNTIRSEME